MRRLVVSILILCVFFCSVSFAEDYFIYTTEYLLEMKSAIEAELSRRSKSETASDELVYQDDNVIVQLLNWHSEDQKVYMSFMVTCNSDYYCTLVSNITEKMFTEQDALSVLRKVKKFGSGALTQNCNPGNSTICNFVWDLGENYNRLIFPIDSAFSIKNEYFRINGFVENTVPGITLILSPALFSLVEIIMGEVQASSVFENSEIINMVFLPAV